MELNMKLDVNKLRKVVKDWYKNLGGFGLKTAEKFSYCPAWEKCLRIGVGRYSR